MKKYSILTCIIIVFVTTSLLYSEKTSKEERIRQHKEVLRKNNLTLSQFFNAYFDEEGNCTAVGNDFEYKILNKEGKIVRTIKVTEPERVYTKKLENREYKFEEVNKNLVADIFEKSVKLYDIKGNSVN